MGRTWVYPVWQEIEGRNYVPQSAQNKTKIRVMLMNCARRCLPAAILEHGACEWGEGRLSPCGALVLHHLCQSEPLLTQSALLTGPFWDSQPSAFGRGVWRILPFLLGSPLGFQTSCIMDRVLMEPGCLSTACWAFQLKTVTAALRFLLLLPF